jgi:prepilin-type N-terminal cleavage/methylation domain-containing protein
MNMNRKIYSIYSMPGMTLVEVVAAIAILGIILVSLTLARSSHQRQISAANCLSEGTRLVDDMISSWWSSPQGVPVESAGILGLRGEWSWTTHPLDNPAIDNIGARVVRVEAVHAMDPSQSAKPIIIDLVLPNASQKDRP